MKTIQYWGAGNVHEGAITGNSRLWYTGMSCPVTDAEATALIAYSASFRLDQVDDAKKDNLVTAETNPVTGGIRTLVVITTTDYTALAVKDPNTEYNVIAG